MDFIFIFNCVLCWERTSNMNWKILVRKNEDSIGDIIWNIIYYCKKIKIKTNKFSRHMFKKTKCLDKSFKGIMSKK
jgi:NTP pyrophosphatase (non-canonical NTP hydrolase)